MLYTNTHIKISKTKKRGHDSKWETSSIFGSDYWDEFGLISTANTTKNPKILVLGAGKGACVRPILARNHQAHITLVDNDALALSETKNIFKKYFPEIKNLEYICKSAEDFIREQDSQYDIIWVDLYSNIGYADCMHKESFYQRLKQMLCHKGVIAINCFTIPTPLALNHLSTAESYLTHQLRKIFTNIEYYPYRRNVTIVGRQSTNAHHSFDAQNLTPKDRLVFSTQTLRLKNKLILKENTSKKRLPSFAEIDQEFRTKWLQKFSKQKKDIRDTLNSTILSNQDLTAFCKENDNGKAYLSVLVGAMHKPALDKIFVNWGLQELNSVSKLACKDIHYFITQLIAIIARNKVSPETTLNLITKIKQLEVR